MSTATIVIVIVIVITVIAGGILGLRASARTGMPSKDVLKRASERARQLHAQEKDDGSGDRL